MTEEQKKSHALRERLRRANATLEEKERELLRSRRRYAEGKKDPEWMRRRRERLRLGALRRRRLKGIQPRTSDRELIRKKRRAKEARYWKRSLQRRLSMRLRARLQQTLKGSRKSASALRLLGCGMPDLITHLASLFKPGMTWENCGPVWHIDHIRPCAKFDLSDPKQQEICFHWTNLQPLFAKENLTKGDR